jgi:hypothetical protein
MDLRRIAAPVFALVLTAHGSATAAPAAAPPRVALLGLAPGDTGIPYSPLPRATEMSAMRSRLRTSLAASLGFSLIASDATARELRKAAFDQDTVVRSCVAAECARKIGVALRADYVVFGTVTRVMAVIWQTDIGVVDVRRGTTIGEVNAGYKGDVLAMIEGEGIAGGCVARIIIGRPRCAPATGW